MYPTTHFIPEKRLRGAITSLLWINPILGYITDCVSIQLISFEMAGRLKTALRGQNVPSERMTIITAAKLQVKDPRQLHRFLHASRLLKYINKDKL